MIFQTSMIMVHVNLPACNIINCPEYHSYHASLLATIFLAESIGAGGRSTPIVFHLRDNPIVWVYIPTIEIPVIKGGITIFA